MFTDCSTRSNVGQLLQSCDMLHVGAVAEKPEKPSRYRRKKGLRQLFNANRNNDDASN